MWCTFSFGMVRNSRSLWKRCALLCRERPVHLSSCVCNRDLVIVALIAKVPFSLFLSFLDPVN